MGVRRACLPMIWEARAPASWRRSAGELAARSGSGRYSSGLAFGEEVVEAHAGFRLVTRVRCHGWCVMLGLLGVISGGSCGLVVECLRTVYRDGGLGLWMSGVDALFGGCSFGEKEGYPARVDKAHSVVQTPLENSSGMPCSIRRDYFIATCSFPFFQFTKSDLAMKTKKKGYIPRILQATC